MLTQERLFELIISALISGVIFASLLFALLFILEKSLKVVVCLYYIFNEFKNKKISDKENSEELRKLKNEVLKKEVLLKKAQIEIELEKERFSRYLRREGEDEDIRTPEMILGLDVNYNSSAVERAYMLLRAQYHPDKHSTRAPDMIRKMNIEFIAIKKAYERLSYKKQANYKKNAVY